MLNGQRPHVDFYSNLGVLTYVPTLVSLWLAHGTAWAFGYGQAITALGVGLWSYMLARNRFTDASLVLLCLAMTLFTAAPSSIGWLVLKIGPATTYNRLGYALIVLILIEAVSVNQRVGPRNEFVGGLSSGCVLGTLLFLKITYCAAGIFLLLALIPCRPQTRDRCIGIALGSSLIVGVLLSYLRFALGPMIKDLLMVAGAKRVHLEAYMLDEIFQQAGLVLVFSIGAGLCLMRQNRNDRAKVILTAGVLVSVVGLLLIFSNTEEAGFPLGGLWAIIVLNECTVSVPTKTAQRDYLQVSVVAFGFVLAAGTALSGALSIGAGLAGRIHYPNRVQSLDSPVLRGFLIAGDERWYTDFVNDGLALIRKFQQPNDSVMALDFANPFSFALGMKPARGGTTVLNYQTTFGDVSRPSGDALLGSASLVMLPKTFSDGSLYLSIDRLYGPYLDAHFVLIAESNSWKLYRRHR